jgi:hypothetical protein
LGPGSALVPHLPEGFHHLSLGHRLRLAPQSCFEHRLRSGPTSRRVVNLALGHRPRFGLTSSFRGTVLLWGNLLEGFSSLGSLLSGHSSSMFSSDSPTQLLVPPQDLRALFDERPRFSHAPALRTPLWTRPPISKDERPTDKGVRKDPLRGYPSDQGERHPSIQRDLSSQVVVGASLGSDRNGFRNTCANRVCV